MHIRNIRLVFAFSLGLGSILAVSGSQGMESKQLSPVWMADNDQPLLEGDDDVFGIPSFAQEYLAIARKLLKDESRNLQKWMLENLSTGPSREMPRVIIDLPPAIPKSPKTEDFQFEQVIKPFVPTEKVAPARKQAPVLIGPNYAVEPRALLPGKPETRVSLKQGDPVKAEKPALISVQAQKVIEKKAEEKVKEISKVQMQKKVTVALAPTGVGLMLGSALKLGMTYQGNENSCIIKKKGYVHFCVQTINWPEHIRAQFKTTGSLYKATHAIVRYDGKRLTHSHAIFFEIGFNDVISYIKNRYGPPIEVFHKTVTPFEGRPRDNPTFIWRKKERVIDKSINVTLEVRKYDDVGGGFPDMRHGFIRLYGDSSLPIFPQVSKRELMLVKYLAQGN
jgi:hypothetical protein